MAKTVETLQKIDSDVRQANNRMIGSGVVMPGDYSFDKADKVQVRYSTETLEGSGRSFTTVELQTTEGRWVNLGNLLKRTKVDTKGDALEYVNAWVNNFSSIWEIADALAGHTLSVSRDMVKTYSNFKGGEQLEHPVENGKAYRAEIK